MTIATVNPIRFAGTLAVAILGVIVGLAVTQTPTSDASVAREDASAAALPQSAAQTGVLAQLGLNETQRKQIERIRAQEQPWVEELQHAVAATEQELRRAELAQPFDAGRVNDLIAHQAELSAYLRGTESRVVSEIAELLTSKQQRRFAQLRSADANAPPRADAPPRRPPEVSSPDSRASRPAPPTGGARSHLAPGEGSRAA